MKYSDLYDPNRTFWITLADQPLLLAFVGLVVFVVAFKLLAAILPRK